MDVQFNFVNKKRKPTIVLCNPNGQELCAIGLAREIEYSKQLNALSELTFELSKYKDEEVMPYYHDVKSSKYIKVEDNGIYIVKSTRVNKKGTSQEYKTVNCVGLEYELSSRNLDVLDGTYCLYNASNTDTEKSIMHIVLSYLPNWTISSVDSELWDKWRTFSIQDVNIYNFLMSDVSKTYDCVFLFDTFNRQIKVVKTDNLSKQTDAYMSGRNLVKELDIDDDSDGLVTALNVYGNGDLSIRTVNPLGTPTIYNFDYFMTTDWMSQPLITALTSWKTKCSNAKLQFSNTLLQLKTKQNELVVLESQLKDLETADKSLKQGQSLAITNGDNVACADYATKIKANDVLVANKKREIETKNTEIATTQNTLLQIPKDLSINNTANFSEHLRRELDLYIKQASVQNTDYSVTDSMTNDEILDVANELLAWGETQLNKSSQPAWTFDISAINFFNLIEYKHITNQIELGSEVTIEVDKNRDMYASAMLIGYKVKLDKPDDISLTFSSALNFRKNSYTFDELFDKTASISKSYDFENPSWKKGQNVYDMMNEYIKHGFIDLTNEVLSADNQEFEISNTGIRGREYLPATKTYSPEELRMTKNVLAFSDDNFNTTKTAIGRYKLPDGTYTYGIIAQSIIGRLIMGNRLEIADENGIVNIAGDLITIKNDKKVEKVKLGKYDKANNKYGLQLLNTSGNVVLDESGILQSWQEGKCDNVASGYPLRLYVYVPSGTKNIRKASLRWKVDKFRAFSTATGGGGSQSTSTDNGGGTSDTTESKSAVYTSTDNGGSTTATSDAEEWKSGSDGHNHGIGSVWLATTNGGTTVTGSTKFVASGQHSHSVYIPSHYHDFTVPSHYHSFSVPSHSHDFTIGDHTHSITYGIYESTTPVSIKVTINGTQRGGTYSSDMNDFDISTYLAVGQWNTIEISSTRLGRIDATCFIQALMSTD